MGFSYFTILEMQKNAEDRGVEKSCYTGQTWTICMKYVLSSCLVGPENRLFFVQLFLPWTNRNLEIVYVFGMGTPPWKNWNVVDCTA